MPPHRKRCKSYNEPGHAHALTFSCFHRLLLLSKDRSRHWLVETLARARRRRRFRLWAYVIMPEHVHLVIWPEKIGYEIRQIRAAIKIPVQRQALAYLRRHHPRFLERLRDEQPNGEIHYRFWQRGGGYDRNIQESETPTNRDRLHSQ